MEVMPEGKLEASIIGVDLGQARDFTAIAVVQQRQDYKGWPNEDERIGSPYYKVLFLHRLPLGTDYTVAVDVVKRMAQDLKDKHKKPEIVIDFTGVGRPIYNMFQAVRIHPYGIGIHGGREESRDGRIFNVPSRDLAAVLQVLYQQKRINVSNKLKDAQVLNDELLNFQVKINAETGHDSYSHRSGKHDDYVLAVACACWLGEKGLRRVMASNLKRKLGL